MTENFLEVALDVVSRSTLTCTIGLFTEDIKLELNNDILHGIGEVFIHTKGMNSVKNFVNYLKRADYPKFFWLKDKSMIIFDEQLKDRIERK